MPSWLWVERAIPTLGICRRLSKVHCSICEEVPLWLFPWGNYKEPGAVKCQRKWKTSPSVRDFLKTAEIKKKGREGAGVEGVKLESFCLFTLDEGRGRKKKIKEPVEDVETLHCLTLMNAQTWQPEKRKYSIFGVKKNKCKIFYHYGEGFVTSFYDSQTRREFESKAFSIKIKVIFFIHRNVTRLSFSFSKFRLTDIKVKC